MRSRGSCLVRGAGARCRAPACSARPASPPPLACRLEGLCSGSAACRSREPPNGPAPPWRRAEPGQPRGGHGQASWGGHTQNLCHAGHTAPGAAARPCPCAAPSPGAPGARVLEKCTAHLESPPPHNIALSLRASGHYDAQKPHVPVFQYTSCLPRYRFRQDAVISRGSDEYPGVARPEPGGENRADLSS